MKLSKLFLRSRIPSALSYKWEVCRRPAILADFQRERRSEWKKHGLVTGDGRTGDYVMCEIPSNVTLAEEFSKILHGFPNLGPDDLTQLKRRHGHENDHGDSGKGVRQPDCETVTVRRGSSRAVAGRCLSAWLS